MPELKELLEQLDIPLEAVAAELKPMIVEVVRAEFAASLKPYLEQTFGEIRDMVAERLAAVPKQVEELTVREVRPAVEAFRAKSEEIFSQAPAAAPAGGHQDMAPSLSSRLLGSVLQNPETMNKVLTAVIEKVFTPKQPDPFAVIEQAAQTVERMKQIVSMFSPGGYSQEQVARIAQESLLQGMRIKQSAVAGGPTVTPLPVPMANDSSGRSNGHSRTLADFYPGMRR